jgi:hypothetical protein
VGSLKGISLTLSIGMSDLNYLPFFLFNLSTNLVTFHSVVSVLNVVKSPVIKNITILTKIQDSMCDFVNHKV